MIDFMGPKALYILHERWLVNYMAGKGGWYFTRV